MEIVQKFGFWIMTKNDMQGCAGYVHTSDRKVYLEVLFPSNYPNSPIIINMPRDLRHNPTFFQTLPGLIQETTKLDFNAAKVIELIKVKLTTLPAKEVKESLVDELEEELNLIKGIYNMKTVEGKKYHIRIFYQLESKLNFEVEINFKDYPRKPEIIYQKGFEKIIGTPKALQIIQSWNSNNPPHIIQIIQEIEQKFTSAHGIEDIEKLISVKNLTVINSQRQMLNQKLSFTSLKGDIIGIFCLNKEVPIAFFKAILGKMEILEGEINVFGRNLPEIERNSIKFLDFQQSQESLQSMDKTSIVAILEKSLDKIQKKEAKKRISTFLSIIGLANRRNFEIKELSEGEKRRLILASSLINLPSIVFLIDPEKELNSTEKNRIWDAIIALNDQFSITMFIYSNSDEIKRCHNILVLSRDGKQLGFGTLPQLVGELPLFKEVIVIELNSPNSEQVKMLGKMPGATFLIEERQGEKYRLFTKSDPNQVIPEIFGQLGSNVYKISKEPPSLIDFIPYKRIQKK